MAGQLGQRDTSRHVVHTLTCFPALAGACLAARLAQLRQALGLGAGNAQALPCGRGVETHQIKGGEKARNLGGLKM
mgnify:CR=1 FL=1